MVYLFEGFCIGQNPFNLGGYVVHFILRKVPFFIGSQFLDCIGDVVVSAGEVFRRSEFLRIRDACTRNVAHCSHLADVLVEFLHQLVERCERLHEEFQLLDHRAYLSVFDRLLKTLLFILGFGAGF